jgi:UDP-N-acetylmuramate dehydrogenase
MDRNNSVLKLENDELKFSYRGSSIKENGFVVLEATFSTVDREINELSNIIEMRLADRARKHPDPKCVNTAGSFFKNPLNGDGVRIPAGKLLEDSGCKHLNVGGAKLWHSHANIIVTDDNATAQDVKALASKMTACVKEKQGIELSPEVSYLE